MKAKTKIDTDATSDKDLKTEPVDTIEAIENAVVDDINKELKDPSSSTIEDANENKGTNQNKLNVFSQLTQSMRDKRSSLLSKIDEIKSLRERLKGLNQTGVRALEKKKERLEFKISTEAITLDKERALMKEVKAINDEIKAAASSSDNRRDVVTKIKQLDGEIEILKNELDEMKLELIKLREDRKKRKQMIKKKKEAREARAERGDRGERFRRRPEGKAPTEEEMFVSLEDIVVINKK